MSSLTTFPPPPLLPQRIPTRFRFRFTLAATPHNRQLTLTTLAATPHNRQLTLTPLAATHLPLHSKNPHAIYRDLQRLARLNKLREALTVLDYLEHRGIPLNPTTFSALLSACLRLRSLPHARQLHVHLRIHNLHHNEYLLTKLVQLYSACNSPDDAKFLLNSLAVHSPYPWNALLKGCLTSTRRWGQRPVTIFFNMREAGVEPNEYTFSCLIKSFAGSPALTQGSKAHALLIKNGFAGAPEMIQTGLIDMYFKCRKPRLAMKVFDEMGQRDVVAWGAVIAGFAHNRLQSEAVAYMQRMCAEGIEVNSVVLTTVLPVIGELAERKLGREIHGYVLKRFRGFANMVFVHSGLIDMYCKCGDMVSGRRVFYGSTERNVVIWTALMSGYASNGRFEQALRSMVWMQQEGIKPDVVSVATALPVCTKLKALKQGREIHGFAVKNLFLPNISIATSLMTMYSACGKLEYACKVFGSMEKKNVIAWTALVDSYLKNGRPYDALDVFRSMRLSDLRPDALSLANISNAAAELGALVLGKEVHGQVLKMKFESNPLVIAQVMRMYGKCGDIAKARKVFDAVLSKGSLTWTAIIEAYGFNGQYREALDLFDCMLSSGYIPSGFTFYSLLTICDQAGLVDDALSIFDIMTQKYNLKACEEHYICIIGLLSHAGRFDQAQRFVSLRSTLAQM